MARVFAVQLFKHVGLEGWFDAGFYMQSRLLMFDLKVWLLQIDHAGCLQQFSGRLFVIHPNLGIICGGCNCFRSVIAIANPLETLRYAV